MNFEIRQAESRDIEGMSVVVDSAWRKNYRHIFTDEQISAFTGNRRRESFTKILNDGKDVYVLTVYSMITAVCAAQSCEEPQFAEYAEIIQLYVLPGYQRMGFGRKLLSYTLQKLSDKDFKGAFLYTAEKNENACRFYEKCGFTACNNKKFGGVVYIGYKIDFNLVF